MYLAAPAVQLETETGQRSLIDNDSLGKRERTLGRNKAARETEGFSPTQNYNECVRLDTWNVLDERLANP
ncbi:hypothetical protein CH373_12465 [Leptospira perolatii]|uniref:Uncharacterized protein n=1 Tax=Leptospira perolatii TaxID=2023191 RepID=A0A2M9ZLH1_9LEPT|nr:hypothetical protein CH360_06505 [Leptospira perolatii]PJZ72865.1 hypothetical protein CH373_12465 [Leptospira perolatii]